MPIYEYRCEACGHELEKLQKISADPLTICPECEKPELKKLVSAAGFRLKGKGWYETDFKGGNAKNLHAGDGKDKSSNKTDSSSTKSDAGGSSAKSSSDAS